MKLALRRGWKLAVQLVLLMALLEVAGANRAPRWGVLGRIEVF